MSLDKDFDSIACKDAANAKEILKSIKKTEDKVSEKNQKFKMTKFNCSIKMNLRKCTRTFKTIC
jgi:hypothetical protein